MVERQSYLLELCRNVVLNPVHVAIVKRLERYPWSSYRATAGLEPAPSWLTTDWVLGQFGRQRRRAQTRYADFVEAGIGAVSPRGHRRRWAARHLRDHRQKPRLDLDLAVPSPGVDGLDE